MARTADEVDDGDYLDRILGWATGSGFCIVAVPAVRVWLLVRPAGG
jgi:hypothetical protein